MPKPTVQQTVLCFFLLKYIYYTYRHISMLQRMRCQTTNRSNNNHIHTSTIPLCHQPIKVKSNQIQPKKKNSLKQINNQFQFQSTEEKNRSLWYGKAPIEFFTHLFCVFYFPCNYIFTDHSST